MTLESPGAGDRPVSPPNRKPGAGRPSNQTLGARGEDVAVDHLLDQGLQVIERNWRCRWGEIDIVATERFGDRRRLVFCEVKTRSGLGYGSPLEAITFAKMQRLRRLAGHWLEQHRGLNGPSEWAALRIGAVGVVLDPTGRRPPQVDHVRAVG